MGAVRLTRDALSHPRRWPIRVTTTVVATAVVTLVLAVAAGGAWLTLRGSVHAAVDTADRSHALDLVAVLEQQGPAAALELVAEPATETDLVRVLGPGGRPLALRATQGIEDLGPLWPTPAPGQVIEHHVDAPDGSELRVTAVGVDVGGAPFVVEVGTDTGRFDAMLTAAAALFLGFVSVAGLVTAVLVAYAMGRVLRPVESIRARVAEISASGHGERVPVPGGQDEITRLAETMNAMLARLDAARTAQVAFVGDASHELRSPLSTLSTMLELSSTSGTPVDVETVDDLLLPEVVRMRSMVEDLLLLAKNDERGVPLRHEDVDLDDVVLAEAARLRGLGDRSVSVHVEPARLTGDPDALVRVVRNLADNARRYAASAVTLGLTVDRTGPGVPLAVLTVDDDGEGVPPGRRATVFDRFARLHADRARDTGGSGLGLAIVAEITRSHGGTVRVEDAPGGGARFVAELPVEQLETADDD